MIKTQKGFTLIELLVVIAIIGILAGILFVAIDPAKQTGKSTLAAIQSQMVDIRTSAVVDNAADFSQACDATSVKALTDSIAAKAGVTVDQACVDDIIGFVYAVTHVNGDTTTKICVDSLGVKEGVGADAANFKCN